MVTEYHVIKRDVVLIGEKLLVLLEIMLLLI